MKRAFSSFAAIALVSAIATTVMAQSPLPGEPGGLPGAPATPPNGGPIAKFDNGYLDHHPEVAQQLANNPGLVDNQQFLASHPGLQSYLTHHPHVSTDLQHHPERFMNAESQYERSENNQNWHGRSGSHPFRNWRRNHGW